MGRTAHRRDPELEGTKKGPTANRRPLLETVVSSWRRGVSCRRAADPGPDRPHHAQQRLRHVVDTVDRGLQTRRQLRVPLTELPDACCVLKSSPRRVSTCPSTCPLTLNVITSLRQRRRHLLHLCIRRTEIGHRPHLRKSKEPTPPARIPHPTGQPQTPSMGTKSPSTRLNCREWASALPCPGPRAPRPAAPTRRSRSWRRSAARCRRAPRRGSRLRQGSRWST